MIKVKQVLLQIPQVLQLRGMQKWCVHRSTSYLRTCSV